ncbi:54S ribosomal protein L8, mitochondrial, partial [Massospora cicadina]
EHDITIPKLEELAERFKDREGGYTRLFKNGNRTGDNAPMGIIEYIGEQHDLQAFLITRAEARRRLEKENFAFQTADEIQQFLETCKAKNAPLQKQEYLRLKIEQKNLITFERRIEKVKIAQKYDDEAWENAVRSEMEILTQKTKELQL